MYLYHLGSKFVMDSLLFNQENDSSKQLESYQSQIVELKSALQSSRSEMEVRFFLYTTLFSFNTV